MKTEPESVIQIKSRPGLFEQARLACLFVVALFLALQAGFVLPAASQDQEKGSQAKDGAENKEGESTHRRRVRGNAPCLAWVDWEKPVRAVIVCVHGLGLHNGTYEDFGVRMKQDGFAVYAIDVRGFGSWMAAEGRKRVDFDHCLEDIKQTLKVVRRAHPDKPVFLLGESMGGAIALRATAMYPDLVDGLVSSVPAGDRFKQGKTSLKVALRLLSSPDKPFNVGEEVIKQATVKPELREAWMTDPLARMKLSPRELLQFQSFMNGNHDSARQINETPVLIVQGCKDHLVRPEGTIELFNKLNTADRKIILMPNAEHLIFEEGQFREKNIEDVLAWLETRIYNWELARTASAATRDVTKKTEADTTDGDDASVAKVQTSSGQAPTPESGLNGENSVELPEEKSKDP